MYSRCINFFNAYLVYIICTVIFFAISIPVQTNAECRCDDLSGGRGIITPFPESNCVSPVQRPHPQDSSTIVNNCTWTNPIVPDVPQEPITAGCRCDDLSGGRGIITPFPESSCVSPVQRPHPQDASTIVYNCSWSGTLPANLPTTPNNSVTPMPEPPAVPVYEPIPYSLPSTDAIRVGSARSLPDLIGRGLRLFTGFFGSIALIMVIYGGIEIMVAGGQSDKIKQGTSIIVWASIGLTTMILSYVLVQFVFGVVS